MEPTVETLGALLGIIGVPAAISYVVGLQVARFAREALTERLKSGIKAEYDAKLETLKAQLKAGNDVELERIKNQLVVQADRQKLLFSSLHAKRAEILAQVYAALFDYYESLGAYTSAAELFGMPSRQEKLDTLKGKLSRFRLVYTTNRIYIPKKLSVDLDNLEKDMLKAGNTFIISVSQSSSTDPVTDAWIKVIEKIEGPIKTYLELLEAEFRKLLGDDV
jgi:hypothetical protein